MTADTIFALSSGRPPAAIGVLRISGPSALDAAARLAGPLPPPRRAALRALRDDAGALIDRALVIAFPGPATATGEDLVELHCHGGRAIIAAVERALTAIPGCCAAEPGEFTRRALTGGRIDLAEAEGLADLLEAETESQRVAALAAAEGVVSHQVNAWLAAVAELSARVEAVLDHSDEDDVASDEATAAVIAADARALGATIAVALEGPPVERLRDGLRIVIGGPPNSGKSTLLNLLTERDAAIVSPIAGTTRDRIEAGVVRGGMAYLFLDTAGLTATDDPVEAIGVERASAAIASADLLIWMADVPPPRTDALWVHGRADLPGREHMPDGPELPISERDPMSLTRLWAVIETRAMGLVPRADALPLRRRHRELCAEAADLLAAPDRDMILFGEQLRRARQALAQVTGADATEAMLDALFSRFCIGK